MVMVINNVVLEIKNMENQLNNYVVLHNIVIVNITFNITLYNKNILPVRVLFLPHPSVLLIYLGTITIAKRLDPIPTQLKHLLKHYV